MVNYTAYLKTKEWALVRDREIRRAGRCCEFCGERRRPLHVHHLNYDNLGNETTADLIVLCDWCHKDVHEFPRILESLKKLAQRRQLQPRSDPGNFRSEGDLW